MIFDFHTHIFPLWLREQREKYLGNDLTFGALYDSPKATMASTEDLLAAMDEDGVDRSVIMGVGWTDFGLACEANDYIIESVNRYPDRLIGFAGISPVWGKIASDEAERCANRGLKGIGELHPYSQGFDLGDKNTMAPLMELVEEFGLIVTTHSSEPVGHIYQGKGNTRPEVLWQFIQNFPEATIVCAHWGGGLPFYALMPEVKASLTNVYFDTAASPFLYSAEVFSTATRLVGTEKILLGSDYALLRAKRLVAQVKESGLPESQQNAILGGNAERLLASPD